MTSAIENRPACSAIVAWNSIWYSRSPSSSISASSVDGSSGSSASSASTSSNVSSTRYGTSEAWVCSRSHGHCSRSVRASSWKRTYPAPTGHAERGHVHARQVVGRRRRGRARSTSCRVIRSARRAEALQDHDRLVARRLLGGQLDVGQHPVGVGVGDQQRRRSCRRRRRRTRARRSAAPPTRPGRCRAAPTRGRGTTSPAARRSAPGRRRAGRAPSARARAASRARRRAPRRARRPRRRAPRRSPRRPRRSGRPSRTRRRTSTASGTRSALGWRAVRRKRCGMRAMASSVSTVTCSRPPGPSPTTVTTGRAASMSEGDDGARARRPSARSAGRRVTSAAAEEPDEQELPAVLLHAGRRRGVGDLVVRPHLAATCHPAAPCTGPTMSPGVASASASTTSEPSALGRQRRERRTARRRSPCTAPPLALDASSVERSTSSAIVAPSASSSMTSSAAASVGSTTWRTHTSPRRPATRRSAAPARRRPGRGSAAGRWWSPGCRR